jgi:uncharacterized damage-inducible protein DinB
MTRIIDTFIGELEQEAATTRKVLERVPADKFGWKPHEKSFSLGDLAHHLATIPGGIAQMVSDSFAIENMQKKEPCAPSELLSTLDDSLAKAKEILGAFDDAKLMENWSVTKGGETIMEMPRIAAVRAILLNHWYHHRGQMTVYLRLLDVPVPSVYGPSADDNPFE